MSDWLSLQVAIALLWPTQPPCAAAPEAWWATRATPASAAALADAVEACGWCPLLEPCRAYAIAAGERHGVWGGLTAEERREVRS